MYAQPQSLLPNFISGNADRLLHATMGKFTGGLSPAALSSAWLDWAMPLAISPSKQAEIAAQYLTKAKTSLRAVATLAVPDFAAITEGTEVTVPISITEAMSFSVS